MVAFEYRKVKYFTGNRRISGLNGRFKGSNLDIQSLEVKSGKETRSPRNLSIGPAPTCAQEPAAELRGSWAIQLATAAVPMLSRVVAWE